MRVLAVCLGNICRSPTAEAAIAAAAARVGIDLEVDSAGTGSWHVGEPPDPRMRAAAAADGLDLDGTARQVSVADFAAYDLILAMDRSNHDDLLALAPDPASARKVRLFRDFDPDAHDPDVPDPYYDGPDGFATVVRIVRAAADGLVAAIDEGRL